MNNSTFIFFRLRLPVIFLFIIATTSLKAQQPDSIHAQEKIMLDSLLAGEHLDTLSGYPVTFYSHGYGVRAKAIQELVRSCIQYYQKQFPGDNYTIRINILNKADWEKLPFPQPYGLPHFTDVNQSMMVSADKDAVSKLNNEQSKKVDDKQISGFDYVAIHELGHYFFFTLHNIKKEHWLNETLASYFLICYLKEKKLNLDLGNESPEFSPKYKTLEDFDKLYAGLGPQNYNWYQRKFIDLDFSIYPDLKMKLINDVLKNYAAGGKNMDGMNLFESLSAEKMNAWLTQMH